MPLPVRFTTPPDSTVPQHISSSSQKTRNSGCPLAFYSFLDILRPLVPHTTKITQANVRPSKLYNYCWRLPNSNHAKGPSWPHAFDNSISSESIEAASGNRGVILHKYGAGRLEFADQNLAPIRKDTVNEKGSQLTRLLPYRPVIPYREASPSRLCRGHVRAGQPRAPWPYQ